MAEDERQKRGSSVVDRANNLYGKTRNLQSAYNAYKKIRLAMAAGEGLSALAGAVPVAVGVIILVVFIIIISGAAPSTVSGGDLGNNPSPSSSSSSGPTTSGSPVPISEMAKYFKISGATAAQQQIIYSMFSLPFKSSKYVALLTGSGQINIQLNPPDPSRPGVLTGGANYDNNTIRAWGFFEAKAPPEFKQHWLIHESIHLIQRRNGMLGFDLNSLQQDGAACYDNLWLKTYAFRSSGSGRGVSCKYPSPPIDYRAQSHESMAEAAANNAMCAPGTPCDFNDYACSTPIVYPIACKNTYYKIRDIIFGGFDFNGLP